MRPWGRSGLLHSNYGSNPITGWSGSDLVGFRGQTAFDQLLTMTSMRSLFWQISGVVQSKSNAEACKPFLSLIEYAVDDKNCKSLKIQQSSHERRRIYGTAGRKCWDESVKRSAILNVVVEELGR